MLRGRLVHHLCRRMALPLAAGMTAGIAFSASACFAQEQPATHLTETSGSAMMAKKERLLEHKAEEAAVVAREQIAQSPETVRKIAQLFAERVISMPRAEFLSKVDAALDDALRKDLRDDNTKKGQIERGSPAHSHFVAALLLAGEHFLRGTPVVSSVAQATQLPDELLDAAAKKASKGAIRRSLTTVLTEGRLPSGGEVAYSAAHGAASEVLGQAAVSTVGDVWAEPFSRVAVGVIFDTFAALDSGDWNAVWQNAAMTTADVSCFSKAFLLTATSGPFVSLPASYVAGKLCRAVAGGIVSGVTGGGGGNASPAAGGSALAVWTALAQGQLGVDQALAHPATKTGIESISTIAIMVSSDGTIESGINELNLRLS